MSPPYWHSPKPPLQHVPHSPENTMDDQSRSIEGRRKSSCTLRSEAQDLAPITPRFETSWLLRTELLGVWRVILGFYMVFAVIFPVVWKCVDYDFYQLLELLGFPALIQVGMVFWFFISAASSFSFAKRGEPLLQKHKFGFMFKQILYATVVVFAVQDAILNFTARLASSLRTQHGLGIWNVINTGVMLALASFEILIPRTKPIRRKLIVAFWTILAAHTALKGLIEHLGKGSFLDDDYMRSLFEIFDKFPMVARLAVGLGVRALVTTVIFISVQLLIEYRRRLTKTRIEEELDYIDEVGDKGPYAAKTVDV